LTRPPQTQLHRSRIEVQVDVKFAAQQTKQLEGLDHQSGAIVTVQIFVQKDEIASVGSAWNFSVPP